jgi:hypothetical protein
MALSAFDDKTQPPRPEDLETVLGATYALWNELQALIAARFAPLTAEWGYTSRKTGWGLRLRTPKRTVLYMTPCQGFFLASFALGEKAVLAAQQSGLPAAILETIANAPRYAEGRGVRIEVRTAEDICSMEKLAVAKMAN